MPKLPETWRDDEEEIRQVNKYVKAQGRPKSCPFISTVNPEDQNKMLISACMEQQCSLWVTVMVGKARFKRCAFMSIADSLQFMATRG